MTLRLALDHNFPRTIVEPLAQLIPEATLTPIAAIDRVLTTLPDWKLLVALHLERLTNVAWVDPEAGCRL